MAELAADRTNRQELIDVAGRIDVSQKDEIEFMQAMDAYKRASGRMFPTCSEILEVVRNLGYIKISDTDVDDAPIPATEDIAG